MATFTVDAAGGHEYELIGAELVKMRATSRGGVTLHNYVFEVESTGSALEGDWRELQFLAHKPAVGGQTDAQGKRRRETELCPSEPQAQRPRGTSETLVPQLWHSLSCALPGTQAAGMHGLHASMHPIYVY